MSEGSELGKDLKEPELPKSKERYPELPSEAKGKGGTILPQQDDEAAAVAWLLKKPKDKITDKEAVNWLTKSGNPDSESEEPK